MKKSIANYVFIAGIMIIFSLNLFTFNMYHELYAYNYRLTAVVVSVVFLCVYFEKYMSSVASGKGEIASLRVFVEDKKLFLLILINAISTTVVLRSGTYLRIILVTYTFTMVLFLADKVRFTTKQMYVLMAFISMFFFLWSINKKRGYTINFAGQVLVGSFVMLITLIELYKSEHLNIAKIEMYALISEIVLYIWAILAIVKYRCRTSFASMLIFGIFFFGTRFYKLGLKLKMGILICSFILIILFPHIYVTLKLNGVMEDVTIFSKQVISGRGNVYAYYLDMIKAVPMTGVGTIYVPNDTPFRAGLLDASNAFLQITVPHGIIIGVLSFTLLGMVLWRTVSKTSECKINSVFFAGIMTFGIVSTSESFMVAFPFVMIYAAYLYIMNSFILDSEKEKE